MGVIGVVREGSPRLYTQSLAIVQQTAHTVEHRLDSIYYYLDIMLDGLAANTRIPSIFTLKAKDVGGDVDLSHTGQLRFWHNIPKRLMELLHDPNGRVYMDWDISLVEFCIAQGIQPPFPWLKIACSIHDFHGMGNPREMLRRAEDTPCQAFIKVVPTATCDADCDTVMSLADGRTDPRPLVAFPMGEHGKRARVESLRRGLAGTYGYVEGFYPAAPGQIPIGKLLEMPEIREVYQ